MGEGSAGWAVDGSVSEHLARGHAGDLCLLVPQWARRTTDPVYELYDVERNVSYWVRQIPTPIVARSVAVFRRRLMNNSG